MENINETPTQFVTYIEKLSRLHKEVKHSTTEKHFFRGEIDEFFMGIRNKVRFPAIISEGYDLYYDESKQRNSSFIVCQQYKEDDNYDQIQSAWADCERIGEDFLRRMIDNPDEICGNFQYSTGEMIQNEQEKYVGIRFSISLISEFDDEIDETKWSDL